MAWTLVTIPRRSSGVGMPERCVYCNGHVERELTLRSRREVSRTKGTLTTTRIEEHVAVLVPYCRSDAEMSTRLHLELRRLAFGLAGSLGILGLVLVAFGLDAPLGVRILFGLLTGVVLGVLGLLAAGILLRRLPRYRDWGAGMLGVDLVAGPEAYTFRFTNSTFAAAFRTRNGLFR